MNTPIVIVICIVTALMAGAHAQDEQLESVVDTIQSPRDAEDPLLLYIADVNGAYTDAIAARDANDYATFVQLMTVYRTLVAGKLTAEDRERIDKAIEQAITSLRTTVSVDIVPTGPDRIRTTIGTEIIPMREFKIDTEALKERLDLDTETIEIDRTQFQNLQDRLDRLENRSGPGGSDLGG